MSQLATSFQQYGAWRDTLAASVGQLRRWLEDAHLLEPDAARRLDLALERLNGDRLVVAFIAEFSRGKSELINAIFFADYGRRILPSSAGRTTMCPTELMYDESLPACIRALPIETRARLGTMSDFKKSSGEWRVFPVDTASPDGMYKAFQLVAETVRVGVDEARMYGLFDPDDPDQVITQGEEGLVEISRWRHAVINFPHPLLKQGLVILDTPGLNAIGTEPELTLSLVPSAHAVLFVLAADTGVTKSDLDVWRHIMGDSPEAANHIAVLNKIDGLWDALKAQTEIEAEVRRQIVSVAETLKIDRKQVFAVSAQKGLVAKVTGDAQLLERSRLPSLEAALVDLLVPARQQIIREQTLAVSSRVANEVRQALSARERSLVEQLYELRALQGKNQSAVERMLLRAQAEQRDFEDNVRKVVAMRVVLARLAELAYSNLRLQSLRTAVLATRDRMRKVRLTPQFMGVVKDYFAAIREMIRRANATLAEIERMVLGVQHRFAEETGWSLPPPMTFTLDTYLGEIDRVEAAYVSHFGALSVLTRDKWSLIERFFETVVGKSRNVFSAAEKDTEAWVRSLLPPLETQVREQRQQLKKRTDAVVRIRDAQESLDGRIGQLEDTLQDVQAHLDELKKMSETIVTPASALRPAAGESHRAETHGQAQPPYLRVEI
ncbi:MAG TPA: dynamin family protein [Burkholderiaceae bacterium]|nr:dynamin family protein [Burkholderiaceae bacterium]